MLFRNSLTFQSDGAISPISNSNSIEMTWEIFYGGCNTIILKS